MGDTLETEQAAHDNEESGGGAHRWGESYREVNAILNPAVKAASPPSEPPVATTPRSPIVGRGLRKELATDDQRAFEEGTESLLQKDRRLGRKSK